MQEVAAELGEMDEIDYIVITTGRFDILAELVAESDDELLDIVSQRVSAIDGVRDHRDVRLPAAGQADVRLGRHLMTSSP